MNEPKNHERKTEVIDATGQYLPEFYNPLDYQKEGIIRADLFWSSEKRAHLNEQVERIWDELSVDVFELTGQNLPDFQTEMVHWVTYPHTNQTHGDNHPASGIIRLDANKVRTKSEIAEALAHEIFHFISQRKLLKNKDEPEPTLARTGMSIIRNAFVGETKAYEHQGWGLEIINEALVEIMSKKALNRAADRIPGLGKEQLEPTAYLAAIRYYHALVQNLTLAWNDPTLRSNKTDLLSHPTTQSLQTMKSEAWQTRFEKLQEQLGLPAQIHEKDLEKVFENTLIGNASMNEVARLINTLLGEGVFQALHEATTGMHIGSMTGKYEGEIWDVISGPVKIAAQQKVDLDFQINSATRIQIKKEELPKNLNLISFETVHEHVKGITEIFDEYKQQIANPRPQAEIDQLFDESKFNSRTIYDFLTTNPSLHQLKKISYSLSPADEVTSDFAFRKFINSLQVAGPPVKEKVREISPGNSLTVWYYQIPTLRNDQLAQVTLSSSTSNSTFYYFVN